MSVLAELCQLKVKVYHITMNIMTQIVNPFNARLSSTRTCGTVGTPMKQVWTRDITIVAK